jgi:triacylglycerol lipase
MDWKEWIYWGRFVQIAYEMYASNPVSPAPPSKFPEGWRLAANVTMYPHIKSFSKQEFAGFMAQSLDDPHHQLFAFRGTASRLDWLADFQFRLEPFDEVPGGSKTERGFSDLYRSMTISLPPSPSSAKLGSRAMPMREYLERLPPKTRLTVTGHSLGGALATLHAFVSASLYHEVQLVTFASPRVGDETFIQCFHNMCINNTRIYNHPDIVPKVPPEVIGYEHVNPSVGINSNVYPIKHSVDCFHSLNTYLYVMGADGIDIGSCYEPLPQAKESEPTEGKEASHGKSASTTD